MPRGRFRFLRHFVKSYRQDTATEEHIREAISSESFPYVVEYAVGIDFAFPQNFDCRKFRGLRYCQLLAVSRPTATTDTELQSKVVTFWRDRQSFDRQAVLFASAIGAPPLLWKGYQ